MKKRVKRVRKINTIHPSEKYIQVGCLVRFKKPIKKKVKNLTDKKLYKIVQPKPGRINTLAGVFVKNDAKKRVYLPFYHFTTTALKK